MSFDVDIGHATERGQRADNEDFVASQRPLAHEEARGFIAAIADGVSSGGGGRMAAQTTVMALVEDYFAAPPTWDTTVVLDRIISAQNAWLSGHNRRARGDASAAMTTLTALALRGQSWTVAHVGDTRAYLIRDHTLRLLTQDHCLDHPDLRSRLTRAIGQDDAVRVDYSQGELQPGDSFVLLSDGVHTRLTQKQIVALCGLAADSNDANLSAQDASAALVQAALKAGSADNASALVVHVRGLAASHLEDALQRSRHLSALPKLKVGDVIDGYAVTALVSDTGAHLLYQVRDMDTRALKALKTLSPTSAKDPQERAMLAHEAWLSARVTERMTQRTSEASQVNQGDGFVRLNALRDPSAFYLIYDWHVGQTLEQLRLLAASQATPLAVADIVAWGLAASRALGRLHRLGVVHRDIKPANFHLGEDGQLRLLDLGVALSGREPVEQRSLHAGTPSYMNPELWDDEPADPQSDLFALGVTLYQLLTGHLPYGEIEPYQKGAFRRDPKPPSRLRPNVPIWLDHVVLKAVARDKKMRFETAEEMMLALRRGASRPLSAQAASPFVARDPTAVWKIAAAVSVVLNLLLVYWLLFLPR
jgi:serine/threonine protein phosphatase PrpC